jgi:hypothetical protein
VSFFEPPPPPEPREQPPRPPWIGPCDGEIGAPAPLGLVLARTDRVAIAIANACAFRNGLTFDLALRVRERAAEERRLLAHGMPFRRQLEPGEAVDVLPPELLRLGVQLADGRKATTLASHRHLYGAGGEPEGPVLVHRGGGGGDRAWDQRFWLWPLPPPGPLAFVGRVAARRDRRDARRGRRAAAARRGREGDRALARPDARRRRLDEPGGDVRHAPRPRAEERPARHVDSTWQQSQSATGEVSDGPAGR